MKTENLNGADAVRLANCIEFAAKLGLSVGEHTQSGLNMSSGNVWLWDEDWSGCIYQDIGFNGPCVSWSCPNCGNEVDCETMDESDDLSKKSYDDFSGGCEECFKDTLESTLKAEAQS